MQTFKKKWNWTACGDPATEKKFAGAFRSCLKRMLTAYGVEVLPVQVKDDTLTGHLKDGDRVIEFTYAVPKNGRRIDFKSGGSSGVVYHVQSQDGTRDGHNRYTSIFNAAGDMLSVLNCREAFQEVN